MVVEFLFFIRFVGFGWCWMGFFGLSVVLWVFVGDGGLIFGVVVYVKGVFCDMCFFYGLSRS